MSNHKSGYLETGWFLWLPLVPLLQFRGPSYPQPHQTHGCEDEENNREHLCSQCAFGCIGGSEDKSSLDESQANWQEGNQQEYCQKDSVINKFFLSSLFRK